MYRNFICYRGGSSAGSLFGDIVYEGVNIKKDEVGETYFSYYNEDKNESRNFLNDPKKYMGNVENVILLLTRDFFENFIIDGKPNPDSVTRIEIDEALKNPKLKFVPVVWPDFSWDGETNGIKNKEILRILWGEESRDRIVGSLPIIPFDFASRKEVVNKIINQLHPSMDNDVDYKLLPTNQIKPNPIFYGREKELNQIKELFDSGEHVIFLQGIGGIGKTQIAMQYAIKNKESYDKVIYATYTNSILDLIISQQSAFKFEPEFPRLKKEDGTLETDEEFFKRKIDIIKNITNERTLIIIDNYDVLTDEHYSDLTNDARFHLLITTRCDYSKFCKIIKIEPLDSIDSLKRIFLDNYEGYLVDEADPHLEELINLVNKHTYTIELIAQHMENSGQTTEEMIDVLKEQGIVSLTESVRQSADQSSVAYENLKKMFKVFDLSDDDKNILKVLSLMPLSGVDVNDIRSWLGPKSLKTVRNLETRSWLVSNASGIALHPVIRDVVRHELGITEEEASPFLKEFNETIKEEKSWHYPIGLKCYYGDIGLELINHFKELNEYTLDLYKNVEVVLSFEVKPAKAVELCSLLYNYYQEKLGNNSFMCAYYSFQAGWCCLFNLFLPNAFLEAKKWFDISYPIFKNIELKAEEEFAVYGHLLTHMARVYLIYYGFNKDEKLLDLAKEYAEEALVNANAHFQKGSPFYSRIAVADMQLAEVLMAYKEYEKALSLLNESFDIVAWMFGEDDPDSVNVSCRKSAVLYRLGRYQEALELGSKNLEAYTKYYGELNSLRFEQLIIVFRCVKKLNDTIKVQEYKEEIIKVGKQLLSNSSNVLEDILNS